MALTKTILYGVMGEGRGHATRSLAVADALRERGNRIVVFTSGDARDFFVRSDYEVIEVPPFNFVYHGGRIQRPHTVGRLLVSLWQLLMRQGQGYRKVRGGVAQLAPHCVITDMEPYTAQAARELALPLIAIDHQHALLADAPSGIGVASRFALRACMPFVRNLFQSDLTIAASFYPSRAKGPQHVHQILRSGVTGLPRASVGTHVTVYLKRSAYLDGRLGKVFAQCSEEQFEVFSDFPASRIGELCPAPNVVLKPISESLFVQSMKSCKAVICTAGNQTIGEAIYLRKPVLALPEPKAFEQEINAIALQESGCGMTASLDEIDADVLTRFLGSLDTYRSHIEAYLSERPCFDSTRDVVASVESVLQSC